MSLNLQKLNNDPKNSSPRVTSGRKIKTGRTSQKNSARNQSPHNGGKNLTKTSAITGSSSQKNSARGRKKLGKRGGGFFGSKLQSAAWKVKTEVKHSLETSRDIASQQRRVDDIVHEDQTREIPGVNPQRIAELRALFNMSDLDQNGRLDPDELMNLVEQMGIRDETKLTQSEVDRSLKHTSSDHPNNPNKPF